MKPLFLLLLILGVATPEPAFAYIDPGTGSIILQAIVGGIAGAAAVGTVYFHKIKNFLTGKSSSKGESESQGDE